MAYKKWRNRIKIVEMRRLKYLIYTTETLLLCNPPSVHCILTLVRANLTRVTSPLNSTPSRLSSYLLMTLILYFFTIFYLPRSTLPDFTSVSSLASLPFLSCCHRTITTRLKEKKNMNPFIRPFLAFSNNRNYFPKTNFEIL